MIDLNRRMANGAAWMVLLRFVERGIGVVSTIILARMLVPADFGVVAMAMSVYGALEIMTSFSFDLALIQNRKATDAHYDTAWTFNVLFGLFLLLGLLALAWPTAEFYADARVGPVMMWLGVAALVRGFENIGVIQFQRDLNLVQEFKLGLARKVVGFMVTISFALAWQSYWALIAGIMAQRVTGLVMSYVLHPYRPRFSLAAKGELLEFTKWLALNNVVLFIVHRANGFRGHEFLLKNCSTQTDGGAETALTQDSRHALYARAKQRNPARWSGHTRDWSHIGAVTLNPERDEVVSMAASAQHTRHKAA